MPRVPARATALRNTPGRTTADPQLRNTPPPSRRRWTRRNGNRAGSLRRALLLRRRMHVHDVGADGDVDGHRNLQPQPRQHARRLTTRGCSRANHSHRLADAKSRGDALVDGGVEHPPGFLGHAESAGSEGFIHFLRRRSGQGDLEVVDDHSAVGGERRRRSRAPSNRSARAQPGLDDVRTETPEDARRRLEPRGCRDDGLEIGGSEQVRQGLQLRPHAACRHVGRAKSAPFALLLRDASG